MSSDHSLKDAGSRTAPIEEAGPGESALQRWSHRKAAARARTRESSLDADTTGATANQAGNEVNLPAGEPSPNRSPTESAPPELPALDQIDINTDFAAFLRDGVDPLLRRAALRRLWTLDPVFAELDGLVEYGEDFSGAGKATSVVHTAIQVTREAVAFADKAAGMDVPEDSTEAQASPGTRSEEQPSSQPAASEPEGNKPRSEKEP